MLLGTLIDQLIELDVQLSLTETDNLQIVAPKQKISSELLEQIRTHKNELMAFLIDQRGTPYTPISEIPMQKNGYPLSPDQLRLWILCQFEGGSAAYHIPNALRIEGEINISALEQAFEALIRRHEILRTVFRIDDAGTPKQFILPSEATGFQLRQLSLEGQSESMNALQEWTLQETKSPFDLSQGPLVRAVLAQISPQRFLFVLTLHHIIGDGRSLEIMVEELLHYYAHLNEGTPISLDLLQIQHKEYVAWHHKLSQSKALEAQGNYWKTQFEKPVLPLNWIDPQVRPSLKTFAGDQLSIRLPNEAYQDMRAFLQLDGATPFQFLLTCIYVLQYISSGQQDQVIGTPIGGRNHQDLENQIGFFVNLIALRNSLTPEETFTEFLDKVKETTLKGYENRHYPFSDLVNLLEIERDRSRSFLFDITVAYHKMGNSLPATVGALEITPFPLHSRICQYDMTFNFLEDKEGLKLILAYNTDLYSQWQVEQLYLGLFQLISLAVSQPDLPLAGFQEIETGFEYRIDYHSEDNRDAVSSGELLL